jgi:hypothetical protein
LEEDGKYLSMKNRGAGAAFGALTEFTHCRQLRSRIQVFSRGSLSFRDSFFKWRISGA